MGEGCPDVDGGYAKLAIHLQKCYAEAERSFNAQLEEMLLLILYQHDESTYFLLL